MVSVALRLSWKEVFGELNGSIGVFEFPAISQRNFLPAISQRNVLPAISFHFFFTVHSSRHFALSVSLSMTNDDHDGRDKRVALS